MTLFGGSVASAFVPNSVLNLAAVVGGCVVPFVGLLAMAAGLISGSAPLCAALAMWVRFVDGFASPLLYRAAGELSENPEAATQFCGIAAVLATAAATWCTLLFIYATAWPGFA